MVFLVVERQFNVFSLYAFCVLMKDCNGFIRMLDGFDWKYWRVVLGVGGFVFIWGL